MSDPAKLLITGDPGCGKTTAIRKLVDRLKPHHPVTGFLTEEFRKAGRRAGFRGVTLDGTRFDLARAGAESRFRVGPYGVVLDGLEQVGIPSLTPADDRVLVVLDEIGKMESFSEPFREVVLRLLDGPNPVLATVAAHGVGFVKKVRQRSDVELIRLTRKSRDGMIGEILRRLAREGIGPGR